jgi:hypothetical protein
MIPDKFRSEYLENVELTIGMLEFSLQHEWTSQYATKLKIYQCNCIRLVLSHHIIMSMKRNILEYEKTNHEKNIILILGKTLPGWSPKHKCNIELKKNVVL